MTIALILPQLSGSIVPKATFIFLRDKPLLGQRSHFNVGSKDMEKPRGTRAVEDRWIVIVVFDATSYPVKSVVACCGKIVSGEGSLNIVVIA